MALADWLEEDGQSGRAELVRLSRSLRGSEYGPARAEPEGRLRELLASGVRACWPQLKNSLGMPFSLVPAGHFLMGAPEGEPPRETSEGPVHRVEITWPFYLGVYQVTQREYQAVTGTNPSHFAASGAGADSVEGLDTGSFPVEMVSWTEAVSFCKKLSALPGEKSAGRVYRLPTEAEWEYACRGAGVSSTATHLGNALSARVANFDGNHPCGGGERGVYLERPTPVGSYLPNVLGLYDMHGNIYEWCNDWHGARWYARGAVRDPRGPARGSGRVLRGGSWFSPGSSCRAAYRGSDSPGCHSYIIGFRLACTLARGA
jgi:formylglycine-generating enzyme required for sulfatase activity